MLFLSRLADERGVHRTVHIHCRVQFAGPYRRPGQHPSIPSSILQGISTSPLVDAVIISIFSSTIYLTIYLSIYQVVVVATNPSTSVETTTNIFSYVFRYDFIQLMHITRCHRSRSRTILIDLSIYLLYLHSLTHQGIGGKPARRTTGNIMRIIYLIDDDCDDDDALGCTIQTGHAKGLRRDRALSGRKADLGPLPRQRPGACIRLGA